MKTMLLFLRLIRAVNLSVIALSLSLFYYLILVPAHKHKLFTTLLPFTNTEFVLFIIAVLCIAAAGNIINDYFDFELDKDYKSERALPQGLFSLDVVMYLHATLALTGIGIGFYLGYSVSNINIGYYFIIATLLLYVYSAYLKRVPLVGNIVIALLSGFVFVLLLLFEANFLRIITFEGGQYVLDMLLWQGKFYGGFAVLTTLAREIVKDLEDREGDAVYKINTLAVQFGEGVAKGVAGLVMLLTVAGLSFFMYSFWQAGALREFYYLLALVVLPLLVALVLLFGANSTTSYNRISWLLKFIMLTGILSMAAFYWFNLPQQS
jgi:4-hydroxybenzoate polyprenyltransferase